MRNHERKLIEKRIASARQGANFIDAHWLLDNLPNERLDERLTEISGRLIQFHEEDLKEKPA